LTRIDKLRSYFEKERLDGYLVADEINILYFTEFLGAARLLIPAKGENLLYVYNVNYEAARAFAKNCGVELLKRGEDVEKRIAGQSKKLRLKTLGFDTLEASTYIKLRKALKGIKLKAATQLVWNLREVKDEKEISYIKKAAELTDVGARTAAEVIKPGIREFEVAAEVEYSMRKLGSEGTAFDTIVASGPRSAFSHGGCTSRKIQAGELIQFDMGARYESYRADLTRTFLVGKPTAKQQKIYDIVMKAQEKAFQKIREGVKAKQVDAAARGFIAKSGFGDNFVHGLGHGVGLAVHEQPTLNSVSKDILRVGNVVTDEPGIYVVGFGGVRIEDTVLVHRNKGERLTKATYELIV
jgi:Xaa-Pro aminopeptidase